MLYLCHLLITLYLSPVCKFRDNTTLKIFLNGFPELLEKLLQCVYAEYLHMFDFSKCFANKFIWQATQDAKKSALQIYINCFYKNYSLLFIAHITSRTIFYYVYHFERTYVVSNKRNAKCLP